MARQNGQLTFQTPVLGPTTLGDSTASAGKLRVFTATERMTVVEVGAIATGFSVTPIADTFSFKVLKREAINSLDPADDTVIPVWRAAYAAQGGIAGDPSVLNFDNANAITGGIIIAPDTVGLASGECLRAFTETSLEKADQLVFEVVGISAGDFVVFYARAYCDGSGLVEACDVDSGT